MKPAIARRASKTPSAQAIIGALWLAAAIMPLAYAADQPTPAKSVLTVNVATPVTQTWDRSLTASGGLFAWQEAIVSCELGGLAISEVLVDVGSSVKRGQPLARLSQDVLRAGVAAQQANVARAKAVLGEAKAGAERARRLKDSGALSEQQIEQLLLAEASATAGLAAAEAALRADEVRLRQTVIQAVDHGVISARNATLGAVVQPGMELFRLVRQGRIEWRAELTAEQLAQAKPGLKARVRLSDGKTAEGTVRMLAPTLDGMSRKAIAYVDLPAGSGARAGMFGQGEIFLGQSAALTVPHAALVLRDGNAYLFDVLADDKVEQRKVQTGRTVGDSIEILSGLNANARVVVRGGAFLNPGDRVQIASDTKPAATAAPNKAAAK